MAIITLALTGSALIGQGRHAVEYACPPFEEPRAWEQPADRPEGCGFNATGALVALIAGILGFALGRATAPTPPNLTKIRTDVDALLAGAQGNAAARSQPYAELAFESIRPKVQAAIR